MSDRNRKMNPVIKASPLNLNAKARDLTPIRQLQSELDHALKSNDATFIKSVQSAYHIKMTSIGASFPKPRSLDVNVLFNNLHTTYTKMNVHLNDLDEQAKKQTSKAYFSNAISFEVKKLSGMSENASLHAQEPSKIVETVSQLSRDYTDIIIKDSDDIRNQSQRYMTALRDNKNKLIDAQSKYQQNPTEKTWVQLLIAQINKVISLIKNFLSPAISNHFFKSKEIAKIEQEEIKADRSNQL